MNLIRVKDGSTHFEAGIAKGGRYDGWPCITERKMNGRGSRFYKQGEWRTIRCTVYKTAETRDANLAEIAKAVEGRLKYKAERKAERSKPHTLKPGTILYTSWGYDQTNIDFFVVVSTTAHTVELAPIASKHTDEPTGNSMAAYVVAETPARICGATSKHRADARGSVNIDGHYASVWDGKPKYESWYA